jgi:hypothetical protein
MLDVVNNTERPVSIRPGHHKPVGAMPVLPPKADLCGALGHIRFGSKADMRHASRLVAADDMEPYRPTRVFY